MRIPLRFFFLFSLLILCAHSLPVIFGYHSPMPNNAAAEAEDEDFRAADRSDNGLFVASVNHAVKQPLSLKGNSISYTEKDLPNYIPVEYHHQPQRTLPHPDRDFHHSYRRLVTRMIRDDDTDRSEIPRYEFTDSPPASTVAPTAETSLGAEPVEECYRNVNLLPRATVRKMNKRRRKLAQSIRRLNKLQRTYCLVGARQSASTATHSGKCPTWRKEKMALYVRLLQLTHCTEGRARDMPE